MNNVTDAKLSKRQTDLVEALSTEYNKLFPDMEEEHPAVDTYRQDLLKANQRDRNPERRRVRAWISNLEGWSGDEDTERIAWLAVEQSSAMFDAADADVRAYFMILFGMSLAKTRDRKKKKAHSVE